MKFCEKEKDCPIYLIHKELNGHYQRLIDELLGKYYYNYGMDAYSCNTESCEDMLHEIRRTIPYSAAKIKRMQRMFDESREKVLAARNEEIEKAYQKGKEDGISRSVSVLNKVVENAREEEREKSYNAGFEQGFTDGQDWANVENSVTLLLALHRAYDFEPDQLMNVVEKSNKYVHQANEGKPTIGTLARQLYNECQIKLCEHEVEILRKYSLFEEGDPYD